ncbi:hypothetical protein BDM02DRAFT_3114616 [Thelephora ganbajun]|uniref:Uncharacterized protein n=1 Tax=Thelephora ganbajun TaxID=370292 RepID=A0ACB6ZH63_THEGA|nr:hypothetical protein BDM02DRAFT_3114616 [Thelephora ganbajun]
MVYSPPRQWHTCRPICDRKPGNWQSPLFSQPTPGRGSYRRRWPFKIEPGSGQYTNYFRLITPSEGLTLFCRSYPDPTFGNYTENDFHPDQLSGFFWEDVKVDKIEYNLDAGKIISSTPITLMGQVVTNKMGSEQQSTLSVNKGTTSSSTFEYSIGFTVTLGMEFSVGVPLVAEGSVEVGHDHPVHYSVHHHLRYQRWPAHVCAYVVGGQPGHVGRSLHHVHEPEEHGGEGGDEGDLARCLFVGIRHTITPLD